MDIQLQDEARFVEALFPFTYTRPIGDIRIGILTLREKWERLSEGRFSVRTAGSGAFAGDSGLSGPTVLPVPAGILPTAALADLIASHDPKRQEAAWLSEWQAALTDASRLQHPWDIFQLNGRELASDYALLTEGRQSAPIPEMVRTVSPENIFIEAGARIGHAILNASMGPIYIGKGTEIMDGACIRGPFALCEGAIVKMGAVIYGATTIGPYSVAGGEIKNSVLFGYSNKGHEGYLGDSVIGEWCNLGAGTTSSNLKNTGGPVKVWDHSLRQFSVAGLKCGLLMGDYSRSAIGSAFNTGTVVGICCNVFGQGGLLPKYIPSFSWGLQGPASYLPEKALQDIVNWKKLKNRSLSDAEIQTLKHIFELL